MTKLPTKKTPSAKRKSETPTQKLKKVIAKCEFLEKELIATKEIGVKDAGTISRLRESLEEVSKLSVARHDTIFANNAQIRELIDKNNDLTERLGRQINTIADLQKELKVKKVGIFIFGAVVGIVLSLIGFSL